MSSFSTIACCIDLTEHNEDIVTYTREMAELTGAKILLVPGLPSAAVFCFPAHPPTGSPVMF